MTHSASPKKLESAVCLYVSERKKMGEFSHATAISNSSVLLGFAAIVGPELPVGKLRERHIVKWLSETRVATSTKRARLSMVRTFCRWCRARGWLSTDPTLEVKGPRVPKRIPRGMQHAAVSKLVSVLPDERAGAIVSLMVQEGLRCVEVARLELGDVDFSDQAVRVRGKGGHERVLPLSAESLAALRLYLTAHPCTYGPLIRSYNDEHRPILPSYISRLVSDWMRQAGVKLTRYDRVSAHALRHTMATDMLDNGAALIDVQRALGHVLLSTTQVYLPLQVKSLREAMGGRSYRESKPSRSADSQAEASWSGIEMLTSGEGFTTTSSP